MIRFLRYLLRRTLLLALVTGLTYFTAFYLFPYIHDKTPLLVALLVTYLLLAYVLIPALIRVLRIFDKPNRIPNCAMTRDGWASDPVNVAVLARNESDFLWAMRKAGWYVSDEQSLRTITKTIWAMLRDTPYPTAPFSNLYLFGRKQDIGLQIPVGNSPRRRHHIRFWKVSKQSVLYDDKIAKEHHSFWRTLIDKFWHKQYILWVGAAIYDSGPIDIMWRNGQLNHRVHRDADYEREFLLGTLRGAEVAKKITEINSGEPYRRWGQGITSTKIISDGYVKLCVLRTESADDNKKSKN
jgi:hypothetical protein